MHKKPHVRFVTATEAKNRFGELIKAAYLHDEHLIVKRDGIPVVAIVPMADYAALVRADDIGEDVARDVAISGKAAEARTHLAEFLDHVHETVPYVPDEEVDQDIEEAIRSTRNT